MGNKQYWRNMMITDYETRRKVADHSEFVEMLADHTCCVCAKVEGTIQNSGWWYCQTCWDNPEVENE